METPGQVSGRRGTFSTHAQWTSHPQHFRKSGYLTASSGKVFHTEEGGVGHADPIKNGPGMPPNEDPPSWSEGLSMQKVNDVANMWGCDVSGMPVSGRFHIVCGRFDWDLPICCVLLSMK
jgi:hypothetical protein